MKYNVKNAQQRIHLPFSVPLVQKGSDKTVCLGLFAKFVFLKRKTPWTGVF
jgi:hypothetical protein